MNSGLKLFVFQLAQMMEEEYGPGPDRAAEKEVARIKDMEDIKSGRKTVEEVRRANSLFSHLNPEDIKIDLKDYKRPK